METQTEVKEIEKAEQSKEPTLAQRIKAKEMALDLRDAEITKKENELKELMTVTRLGGRSEAGIPSPKPIEETPREYAKRVMRGQIDRRV